MKTKNLLLAMTALTALTLSGCSENEVTDINPDAKPAMTFDVYTGVQTKGKETTTDGIKAGFGVLAYKTTSAGWSTDKGSAKPEFMYNVKVSNSGSAWSYSPTKFWPTNGDQISFFAYAPYEDQTGGSNKIITLSGTTETDAPKITFDVNTKLDEMVDLVTDNDKKDQVYTTNTSTNGTVSFELKHVLTKVVLKAKTDTDLGNATKVYITGVKVDPGSSKLCSKATYKFADDEWDYTTVTPTYFSGDINLYDVTNGVLNLAAISGDDTWGYKEIAINITNSETALFKDNEALYFIPVSNATGLANDGDVSLKVSYDIVTKIDDSNHTKSSTTNKVISLPQSSLKKGNFYTYTLVIGMNAIKLEGTVSTTWTTGNSELSPDTSKE